MSIGSSYKHITAWTPVILLAPAPGGIGSLLFYWAMLQEGSVLCYSIGSCSRFMTTGLHVFVLV